MPQRHRVTTHHRLPAIAAAALITTGLVVAWLPVLNPADRASHIVRIEEDQPGWDCHTMGNKVCGPADEAPRLGDDLGFAMTEVTGQIGQWATDTSALTGWQDDLMASGWETAPDMTDPTDGVHSDCMMLVADDVTEVVCYDGWTDES